VRSKIVFALLLLMFVGFGVSFALRPRGPAPVASPDPVVPSSSLSAHPSSSAPPLMASAPPAVSADSPKPNKLMDRPLRVVGLGWDLIAPGALVNDGLAPAASSAFSRAGLDVHLSSLDSTKKLEEALARGGSDDSGADVAVMPMPMFVAAYERLRALDPKVFFVVGWSKGREALYAKEASLHAIPAGKVSVLAPPGSAPALVGLFLLDVAGVARDRITLLDAPVEKKSPTFEAVALSEEASPDPSRGTLLVTTADVPRLVPLVAVAQGGFVAKQTEALTAWARVWLEGEARIGQDAAASARAISKLQGAPSPLVLINRLGPIGWASLGDNARWAGLSGRGAVNLEVLFQRTWRLWRNAGLLSTPLPETTCTAPEVITALVRQLGAAEDTRPRKTNGSGEERLLVTYTAPGTKLDEAAFVTEIGALAGLFERSQLRVSVRGARFRADTDRIVSDVTGRFGLEGGRVVASGVAATKGPGVIEVLAPK
jgi:ABC-type nitrate/sulfonate/bicarbonate transport system substrate-binding protein